MEVIAWIGFSQALFSGLLTLTKSNKSISDRLLSAWLFLLAIEFLTFALESKLFPDFILLTNSFLLFNPALYLYTCSLTNENFKIKKIYLLHLLPYLFFKIFAWVIKEPHQLETFFSVDNTLWFRLLFGTVGLFSWIIYLTRTGIKITKHRLKIQHEFSTIDTYKKIGWLLFIVAFFIMYCISILTWSVFNLIYVDTLSLILYNYSVLLFIIYILGFYGLKQKALFSKNTMQIKTVEKVQLSHLTPQKCEAIQKQLLNYFEKETPYLNPELNMSLLAEELKIPKHHLTEVLNGVIGKNFFHFVNEYRIEKVKLELSDPKNLFSIEAIGYECGFNSKSTFFSVFKKLTGLTPAKYKISKK
ncbi:MAG: helix-turn-helix domain-containing protein [Prolixibacteraceae bacterium]|jgi:AraC-like DNA-binding protein|nr:helix-turn-helix domain-containing protein [Prolixibacteraceae bacterium]